MSTARQRVGASATTVAVRPLPRMKLISPKTVPGASMAATRFPPRSARTAPSSSTKKVFS